MMEKLKVFIWTCINLPKFRIKYWLTKIRRQHLNILDSYQTIDYILKKNISVCRFGDGELQMMSHLNNGGNVENFLVDSFQSYDQTLALRLVEVFKSTHDKILICLPYQFKKSSISSTKARVFWEREWLGRIDYLTKLGLSKKFGDTNFTRFYLDRKDIKDYKHYISELKKIWTNKDILLIEGASSRLGVGNSFLDEANTITRIICPAKNAFLKYSEILQKSKKEGKDKLILIALGHTATVLAYDLALAGFQALDIGHIDIEYEWYKINAKYKVAIPNKYVNEVSSGRIQHAIFDSKYENEIIERIT